MFTGIVKEIGRIRQLSGLGNLYKLSVESKSVIDSSAIGDSVAVNGVCLTVTAKDKGVLHFDVMGETIRLTNLSDLKYLDAVNLEDSLKVGSSLSGHFVSGHIDCVGKIRSISRASDSISMEITVPQGYDNLVVEKGSIALDGISLTVGKASKNSVTVYIIPHTLEMTTLGRKKAGDRLNMEFDMIGKYVSRILNK